MDDKKKFQFRVLNIVDDIKTNLTDGMYKTIVEELMNIGDDEYIYNVSGLIDENVQLEEDLEYYKDRVNFYESRIAELENVIVEKDNKIKELTQITTESE